MNEFSPKLRPKPYKLSRVDIDATGRQAMDLGPSWVWRAAEWIGPKIIAVSMARKDNEGEWIAGALSTTVVEANFVYEVTP